MNVFTHVHLATHLQPTRQYQETTKHCCWWSTP